MKRKTLLKLLFMAMGVISIHSIAQSPENTASGSLRPQFENLKAKVDSLESKLLHANQSILSTNEKVDSLIGQNTQLAEACDTLYSTVGALSDTQNKDRSTFNENIKETRTDIETTKDTISSRTLWAIAIVAIVILMVVILVIIVSKNIRNSSSSIDDVKAAQDALQKAHAKIQEESIAIDNKLVEIINKQIENAQSTTTQPASNGDIDHSLALKVADEIVRIEKNLLKMDSSIKGYKPLVKAVERIRDNFKAQGYEIVEMLNKPYAIGLKASVTFIPDENNEYTIDTITKIIKPQVNFDGKMIQLAQIEVTQHE